MVCQGSLGPSWAEKRLSPRHAVSEDQHLTNGWHFTVLILSNMHVERQHSLVGWHTGFGLRDLRVDPDGLLLAPVSFLTSSSSLKWKSSSHPPHRPAGEDEMRHHT